MKVDYTLYMVTDSTKAILADRDLVTVVKEACEGGVTIVQLRDKTSETRELIRIAKELHTITQKHGIPLLINDRVDVALAVGCEGVHIGQDDIDLATARRLLGPDAIIGVTASNAEEAIAAAYGGADYLGIGTVYATPTKENAKSIIGTAGLRSILAVLASLSLSHPPATVCIGGLNAANLQRTLHAAASPLAQPTPLALSGVAVVSALIAAPDPRIAASHLIHLIKSPPPFAPHPASHLGALATSAPELTSQIPALLARLAAHKPLCHNMTNQVVQNFAANVALCVGGSPIMSANGLEAPDLAKLGGSLVLNMGTATPEALVHYTRALEAYNAQGGPVLLDPVGAGATAIRKAAVRTLLGAGRYAVLKGNEAEVRTLWGEGFGPASCTSSSATEVQEEEFVQHGVDSSRGASLSAAAKTSLVQSLAARERCVVLMTGPTDYISDGLRTFAVENGVPMLGDITGSGCTLGTTVAACAAVERRDVLLAVLAGVVMFCIAGERAVQGGVGGPGSFVPRFLDALTQLRDASVKGDEEWIQAAKVKEVEGHKFGRA